MKIFKCLFLFQSLFAFCSYAATVMPSPRTNVMLSKDPVAPGAAGIIVNAYCYGTNNRGTTNPLSPSSTVFIHIKNQKGESFLLDFPSAMIKPEGLSSPGECGLTKLQNDSVNVNGVQMKIDALLATSSSGGAPIVAGLNAQNLNKTSSRKTSSCEKFPVSLPLELSVDSGTVYTPIQVFATTVSPQSFFGYNGKMDRGTKFDIKVSAVSGGYSDTNKFVQLTAAFPGQDGFCGGYHSPLMVFFDETYPTFTGKTNMLKGKDNPTSWVEENHPGYFLVHLKKATDTVGLLNLFGDGAENANGFEALKKLDSNKDNVLDSLDKEFKNVYLWKDTNSNEKNDPNEIISLDKMKIKSIDLNYNNDYRLERYKAVFKGSTTFKYTEKNKLQTGQIFDVYFEDLK